MAPKRITLNPHDQPDLQWLKTLTTTNPSPADVLNEIYALADNSPATLNKNMAGDLVVKDNPLGYRNDLEAIQAFIESVGDNLNTQRRYQLEVERAMLWMVVELGKPLSSCRSKDFKAYNTFLETGDADINRAAFWRGPRSVKFMDNKPNNLWRPFVNGTVSPATRAHISTVLASALSWLNAQGYLRINVLHKNRRNSKDTSGLNQTGACRPSGFLVHHKMKPATIDHLAFSEPQGATIDRVEFKLPGIQRFIPRDVWKEVMLYVEALPRETTGQNNYFQHIRWCLTFLYCTGARVHEFCTHPMRSLLTDSEGRLFWNVIGKGGSIQYVYAKHPLPSILHKYRKHLSLPKVIDQSENTPLALSRTGKENISRRQVYALIVNLFRAVAEHTNSNESTKVLLKASPHWIRHSVITHLLEDRKELIEVSNFARHSSLEMTKLYVHKKHADQHDRLNALVKY